MATTSQNLTKKKWPDPTPEDVEELLLICRYGELDELKQFIKAFGEAPLEKARDEDGNGILHMVCGNGHIGEPPFQLNRLRFCLLFPSSLLRLLF